MPCAWSVKVSASPGSPLEKEAVTLASVTALPQSSSRRAWMLRGQSTTWLKYDAGFIGASTIWVGVHAAAASTLSFRVTVPPPPRRVRAFAHLAWIGLNAQLSRRGAGGGADLDPVRRDDGGAELDRLEIGRQYAHRVALDGGARDRLQVHARRSQEDIARRADRYRILRAQTLARAVADGAGDE